MGTKRKNKRIKTGRRKCKYGKLKKSVKTKSGRRRRCKKSKRKYKAGELFDKVDRGAKFIQDYASIKDKLPSTRGINCKNRRHVPNSHNCYAMWPRFPCYDEQTRMCFNEDGDTQLIDPIGDSFFLLGKIAIVVANAFNSAKSTLPREKRIDLEKRVVNWFQDRGTDLIPITNQTVAHLHTLGRSIMPHVDNLSIYADRAAKYYRKIKNK